MPAAVEKIRPNLHAGDASLAVVALRGVAGLHATTQALDAAHTKLERAAFVVAAIAAIAAVVSVILAAS